MGCQPSLSASLWQQPCQPKHQLKQQAHALTTKYTFWFLSQKTNVWRHYPQLQLLANAAVPVQQASRREHAVLLTPCHY